MFLSGTFSSGQMFRSGNGRARSEVVSGKLMEFFRAYKGQRHVYEGLIALLG